MLFIADVWGCFTGSLRGRCVSESRTVYGGDTLPLHVAAGSLAIRSQAKFECLVAVSFDCWDARRYHVRQRSLRQGWQLHRWQQSGFTLGQVPVLRLKLVCFCVACVLCGCWSRHRSDFKGIMMLIQASLVFTTRLSSGFTPPKGGLSLLTKCSQREVGSLSHWVLAEIYFQESWVTGVGSQVGDRLHYIL